MTESNLTGSDFSSQPSSAPAPVSPSPVAQPTEKMIPQSQFNDIIGPAKREAYEKGRREAQAEWSNTQAQPVNQQPPAVNTQPAPNPGMSPEDVRKVAVEAYQTARQQDHEAEQKRYYDAEAQKVVTSVESNLKEAQTRYDDFDKVVTQNDLAHLAPIALAAHQVDPKSVGDVLYHMRKNPTTLANVNALMMQAQINQSQGNHQGAIYYQQLANEQIQQISGAIKTNQDAIKNKPQVNAPLSQMQSSNVGTDNGKMAVEDWKSQPWLRG